MSRPLCPTALKAQLKIIGENNGDPEGIRTPVTAVKGRCLRPLDHGAIIVDFGRGDRI